MKQKQKLFKPEQLTLMYHCMVDVVECAIEFLSYEKEKEIKALQERIKDIVPNLHEHIGMTTQAYHSIQKTM